MEIPFKEARTGHTPSEWRTASLKDVCHKEIDRFEPRESGRVYPYVGLEHIESHTHKLNGHGQSNETLSTKNMFRANHILYGKLRPYLNKVWKAEFDGVCTTEILVISSRDEIEQDYLYQLLQRKHFVEYANSMTEGTSLPRIDWSDICSYEIALPPLPEQRKIAEILSTVDEAIEKTDAIIQETQQLKKGLMQKLFTEGIRHSRFKETKIGQIPEEWEVLPVGQIAKDTLLGTNQTSNSRTGIPLMKMGNVAWGQFVFDKVEYVDKETAASLQGFALRDGDFLFNTRNTPELVGKSAVWKAKYGYALYNSNLLRIGFKKNIIHSTDYVSFWMNSHRGLSQLRRLVSGTTSVAAIYWKELRKYPVPVPSLEEQERITKILLEVDSRREAETTYKLELEQLKKGLMQILLTGKVRVKV